jgi:hypothetical protein
MSRGKPAEKTGIVGVPISGHHPPLIGATTGNGGHFLIGTVPPGDYRLYAFDDLKKIEYMDQTVLATFGAGITVHVDPNGHVETQLEMIATTEK